VSQLGFMFVAAGTGNWVAAIFHLGTHAFFKAGLFLAAGAIMHSMEHAGSKTPGNITKMGGLRKHLPITRWCFLIYCLAISGIVPFAGFFSKDEILGGAWTVAPPGWPIWYGKVLWAGLLVAALGTAFYMWRLYFLVFSGDERSEPAKGAHESPGVMTAPLVVLAVLASVAGLVGLPHLHLSESMEHSLAWTHALSTWLAPSVTHDWHEGLAITGEASNLTTFLLMGLALCVALVGIFAAWLMYGARGKGPSPTVRRLVQGPLHGAYEASRHKLWVDEFYDAVIVRPFRAIARGTYEIVDRFIIDQVAINGSAWIVAGFSRISRWIQNGQVQRYLVGIVIGGAAMFAITDCHHHTGFTCTANGEMLELRADPGAGIIGAAAKLRWDVDGDGKPDLDATGKPIVDPVLTRHAGDVGGVVTLWVDGTSVSQKIELRTDSASCTEER
jgi:NADH-quinone oxidoreductase subunit L